MYIKTIWNKFNTSGIYSNKNNKELWQCSKRLLRYLNGSINIKLRYVSGNNNNILVGYVHSDWGGYDDKDRKKTTCYYFKLHEHYIIYWNTRKQASVAVSSTEAENLAVLDVVREALWLKSLTISININVSEPIIFKKIIMVV